MDSYYYRPQYNSIVTDYEDNTKWSLFEGLDIIYHSKDYVEKQSDDLLTQIHMLVDCGYMILTYVNQYYIPASANYHKRHSHHTMLVGEYRINFLSEKCNWNFDKINMLTCCDDIQKKCLVYHNMFVKVEIKHTSKSSTIPKESFPIDKFITHLEEIKQDYITVIQKLIDITKINLNSL